MDHSTAHPRPWFLPLCLVVLFTCLALYLTRPPMFRLFWSDEALYFGVGENIAKNFDFNSHFYLSESLLKLGFPTKDTHPPGFPMLLALGLKLMGHDERVPFLTNYFLLILSVVLIFFIGRKIANSRIGILAALLYLIFPMTLAFSHSAMSEISGSALSVALLAAYFLMPESWAKGLVLALFLGFGYLIKPLALSFVLPMACLAWFSKDPRKKRTFLVFASSFLLLYLAVLKPLTSNREYYPFAANDIFLQAGLFGKVKAAWANIKVNESQLLLFRWTSGEGLTLLAILLLCAVPCWWVAGSKATTDAEQAPIQQAKSLLWITLFAALQSFSAIFIFYEFKIWRGTRGMAFFAPLLCLLFSIGFFHWVKSSTASRATLKRFSALILAVGMLVFLGFSSRVVFQETQRAQRRDFYYFNLWAERLRVFVQLHSLRPKVVASYRNFFYPVRNYPITLIWTLPSNLKDLATIDERLPIDLLELSETDPLFLDNKKSAGDIQKMGEHFTLLGQENGFYYYGRQP